MNSATLTKRTVESIGSRPGGIVRPVNAWDEGGKERGLLAEGRDHDLVRGAGHAGAYPERVAEATVHRVAISSISAQRMREPTIEGLSARPCELASCLARVRG